MLPKLSKLGRQKGEQEGRKVSITSSAAPIQIENLFTGLILPQKLHEEQVTNPLSFAITHCSSLKASIEVMLERG